MVCFLFPLKPLSVQFRPNWGEKKKNAALSFSEQPPSDAGPRESGLSPAWELLNCHKKEAFVTGNTALGSETETDCARKQTTEKEKKRGPTTKFFGTSVISLSVVLKRQISFLQGISIR